MRACYLLLVAATTLLAAVSATTDADHMKLSQIQSIEAAQAPTTKRFLRSYKVTEDEDGSEDDTENEERVRINQLDDVVGDATKFSVTDEAIMKFLNTNAAKSNDLSLVQHLYHSRISNKKLDNIIDAMAVKAATKGKFLNFDADTVKAFYRKYRQVMKMND